MVSGGITGSHTCQVSCRWHLCALRFLWVAPGAPERVWLPSGRMVCATLYPELRLVSWAPQPEAFKAPGALDTNSNLCWCTHKICEDFYPFSIGSNATWWSNTCGSAINVLLAIVLTISPKPNAFSHIIPPRTSTVGKKMHTIKIYNPSLSFSPQPWPSHASESHWCPCEPTW